MTTGATNLSRFRANRTTIAKFTTRLSTYFERNGTLQDIKIKDVGRKEKGLLELILDQGYDEVLRLKVNGLDSGYSRGRPSVQSDY
jgi:hypothetical protein